MALPSRQFLVAFNNAPTDDPDTISTIAAVGTVGAHNVWTDLSAYAMSYRLTGGRQHELAQVEASHLTVELDNNDGRFNPWNTASPYTGLLDIMKPCRIVDTSNSVAYTRFTGHIVLWPSSWPDALSGVATVEAYDALRYLNKALLISGKYAATVLGDSPTAYYRLGDQIGSAQAADSGPSGYTGSYAGTPKLGAAGALVTDLNTAMDTNSFTGWMNPPAASVPTGTGAMTVELWAKGTSNTSGNQYAFLLEAPTTASLFGLPVDTEYVSITLEGSSSSTAPGRYSAYFSDGAGGGIRASDLTSSVSLADSKWHHVVAVRTAAGTVNLYLDGTLVASASAASASVPTGGTCYVGSSIAGFQFGGTLDEVAVYSSALTAAQVAAHYNAGIAGFIQQSADARLRALLDVVSFPSGGSHIDICSEQMQANVGTLTATAALAAMQVVESTEGGVLFVSGDGQVSYVGRQSMSTVATHATVQATFGDNGTSEIPFRIDAAPALDDLDIINQTTVTRVGGTTQTASSASSVTSYGPTTKAISGVLHVDDTTSLEQAQWVTNALALPLDRLRAVTVSLVDLAGSNAQMASVLALGLTYRVQVNRHNIPGDAYTETALIEHFDETMVPNQQWDITFGLSPTDAVTMWVIGDPTYGVIGSTTRLGW
ncbi:MAG: LamG domain-containing protein [Solirubrobacteraceae bacterium]